MRSASLRGLRKRVLGCWGGGEAVLLHQQSNGAPPAAAPLLLGRSCPSATRCHQNQRQPHSLAWDEGRTPFPSIPTAAAKPSIPVLGTSRPSHSLCQHHAILSAAWGGQGWRGPQGIQQSRKFAGSSLCQNSGLPLHILRRFAV